MIRLTLISIVVALALAAPASAANPMSAVFAAASYTPGSDAQLRIDANAKSLTVQPLSAVGRRTTSVFHDAAVGPPHKFRWRPGVGMIHVRIGRWPSGVYFLRVRAGSGRQVVAPVVVRPAHWGSARVAVVVPTYTWQAYNRLGGDSWYACTCVHTVNLARPYEHSGVPYNFAQYDRAFLAWLVKNRQRADFFSDQDLDRFPSGDTLHRLYRLVVFESHGEYATEHMYDVTQRYRDLGGHLAFLSANGFFRKVVISGASMTLIGEWRQLGRPEAALIGSQYIDWFRNRYPNRPYVVVGRKRVPWLFAGTRIRNGRHINGHFGIEIDGLASSSPPGTTVVAEIRNIFPHETAQMTYYTTRNGAEVFNAGTINFGGEAEVPDVAAMLRNIWRHMGPR